jgi:manganese efflux pump family protein
MIATLLVALALSMDAFAVSVASGICIAELRLRYAIRASLFFGFFQFAMPVVGWLLGSTFSAYIRRLDHWIAFLLLALIGLKMIKESFETKDPAACSDEEKSKTDIRSLRTLVVLSIATSIDALAVGLYYSVLDASILWPATIIGVVTFAVCMVGMEFGKRIGARFEKWAALAGGLVLVGIGAKILIEHLTKSL